MSVNARVVQSHIAATMVQSPYPPLGNNPARNAGEVDIVVGSRRCPGNARSFDTC